jgi:transcriptional regulator with XRE-family HTH domain
MVHGYEERFNIYVKTTDELDHEIKAATDVEDFLTANNGELLNQSLSEHLAYLLTQKGVSKSTVIRNSLLDRKYAYQIFSGDKTPSRDKLIAIAFGLSLSVDETQRLLKQSGNRELYSRDKRDAVILFVLNKHGKITDANQMLYANNLSTLGGSPKN